VATDQEIRRWRVAARLMLIALALWLWWLGAF
jgi:hypothetical protein